MKWTMPLVFLGCLGFSLLAFVNMQDPKTNLEGEREIIVMRKIGHQLLLHTGDSSSRILPVKQLSKNEFVISFQSTFSFTPDTLVRIIDQQIAINKLPQDYVVNVLDCQTEAVIYGYAIFKSKQNEIVPCLGREQPEKNYCINIKFAEPSNHLGRNLAVAGLFLIGGIGLAYGRFSKKKPSVTPESQATTVQPALNAISIGSYQFFPSEHLLVYNNEKTVLTQKEARLLGIFAAAPNQVVDRNRLQKEVWEDEGVIVGRSLDMFISKLRKKLELDPAVKLANIHGKGYKLEMPA